MGCLSLAIITLMPDVGLSEETYKFERMWPTLQQPWYFYWPLAVAADPGGFVYVAEAGGNCVVKLDSKGSLITKWGGPGGGAGEFSYPEGIAVDASGNVYVSDQKSVSTTYNQTCQLDANGNGIGNEKEDKELASQLKIGNETLSAGDVPVIGGVSTAQILETETSALLYAEQVIDADGISRVWAVITPPGYSAGGSDTPVTDLPTLDLNAVGNNRYEASYTNFTTFGTYNIAVFAMDRKGVLSLPVQTSVTIGGADNCLSVGSDLSIQVPCAEYSGVEYGFLLEFYPNADDLAGLYWKMVLSTVTQGSGAYCLHIGEDLSMPVPCASYDGIQFGFTLDFYPNPYDPSGIYWKMDLSTAMVN